MGSRLNCCMDWICAACHGKIHQVCSMLHKTWVRIIHRGMISFLSILLFLLYAICCQFSPTEIQNCPAQHPALLSLCPLAEHCVPDRKMQSLPFSANYKPEYYAALSGLKLSQRSMNKLVLSLMSCSIIALKE